MIKIDMKNMDIIKDSHEEYIKKMVEEKIDWYSIFKFDSNDINKEKNDILAFINNTLKDNLYTITLEELNKEMIERISNEYNKLASYELFSDKEKEKIKNVVSEIDEYIKFIDDLKGRNLIKEREDRYLELCDKINNIYRNIKVQKFYYQNINFNRKNDILKKIRKLKKFIEKNLKMKNMNEIVEYIFDYDKFNKGTEGWSRHRFMYLLGINVCPYCNRNYITNYLDDKGERTTADLDHFYCQKQYPYLALSIYNFIPSCQICNSRFKGTEDFFEKDHIYPYEESFSKEVVFKTSFNESSTLNYILGEDINFDIEIKINTEDEDKREKIKNSIETFRLDHLYKMEKEYVREVIQKSRIYNDEEVKKLLNIKGLFSSDEEIKKTIFGTDMDEESLHKKPLSKLTRDIFEEFTI